MDMINNLNPTNVDEFLEHVTKYKLELSTDIGIDLINFVSKKGHDLQDNTLTSVVQAAYRLMILSWSFSASKYIIDKITMIYNQGTPNCVDIALKMLYLFIHEMNKVNSWTIIPDIHINNITLLGFEMDNIFTQTLYILDQNRCEGIQKNDKRLLLVLALSHECLTFDYSLTRGSSDLDLRTIKLPMFFQSKLKNSSMLDIYFDYYWMSEPPISNKSLECLTQLISIRRSMFSSDDAHSKFLKYIMLGTTKILKNRKGLDKVENYHEFCRLLRRFKINCKSSDLVKLKDFEDWIQLIAELVMEKSLLCWQVDDRNGRSAYYLLELLSWLVSDLPPKFHVSVMPKFFVNHVRVHHITKKFITSLMESAKEELLCVQLCNADLLQNQLEIFPYLYRFENSKNKNCIIKIMGSLEREMLHVGQMKEGNIMLSHLEVGVKLAWIVHIIAVILRKEYAASSVESQAQMDAELVGPVLQLVNVAESGLHMQIYEELSRRRLDGDEAVLRLLQTLDEAVLTLLQNLCRSYAGDYAKRHMFKDYPSLLDFILMKIFKNLNVYRESNGIIKQTLRLFLELAFGNMSGNLLLQLDRMKSTLSNHVEEHSGFLQKHIYSTHRTKFYYTIGRSISLKDSNVLKHSMLPLCEELKKLDNLADHSTDEFKDRLTGLMRDLRGIAMAINSHELYKVFFDLIYPASMPIMQKGILQWSDTPKVIAQVLKFVDELISNISLRFHDIPATTRISFICDVCKLLFAYAESYKVISGAICSFKYRGMQISLNLLSKVLLAKYINFQLLDQASQAALAGTIMAILKIAVLIPIQDILAIKKLANKYFLFMEVLFTQHILVVILACETGTLITIVNSLKFGLKDADADIYSKCASAIDGLAIFHFKAITVGHTIPPPGAAELHKHLISSLELSNLINEILKILFEIVLFEDGGEDIRFGYPILSLLRISNRIMDMKSHFLNSKPKQYSQRLTVGFDYLGKVVTNCSLDQMTRDSFCYELLQFRRTICVK